MQTEPIKQDSGKNEMQKALELVEKNKKERQERAFKRITEFILLVEEEENVSVFIQPINIQPQLTIIAK